MCQSIIGTEFEVFPKIMLFFFFFFRLEKKRKEKTNTCSFSDRCNVGKLNKKDSKKVFFR